MLLAAAPYAVGLMLQTGPAGGIREPHTLIPEPSSLTCYLGAFTLGWLLFARPDTLSRLAGQWQVHLGAAVVGSGLGHLAVNQWPSGLATATVVAVADWCSVADLGWPVPVKLGLTLIVTMALLLSSYHLLVRPRALGAWLNGRRYPS